MRMAILIHPGKPAFVVIIQNGSSVVVDINNTIMTISIGPGPQNAAIMEALS